MAEKFVQRHRIDESIRASHDSGKMVASILNTQADSDVSRVTYQEIPVEDIVPRAINRYSQTRIDRLARSIRNTNNRLIHPIVLVKAGDLPPTHEVYKKMVEQGRDISEIKYIIVAGERRYHAWMQLREEEAKRLSGKLGVRNPFDTITANVLNETEALNEKAYYEDSNNQARHLSPAEGVWYIKDAMKDVASDEQKREALIRMNGGSDAGIDEDPRLAARKFRADRYFKMLLEDDLGVSDWSEGTLRNMTAVADKCADEIADALIAGQFTLKEAKRITTVPHGQQIELLKAFQQDREEYEKLLESYKESGERSPKKFTHSDTRRALRSMAKGLKEDRRAVMEISAGLGHGYNKVELDTVKKIDSFLREIDALIERTK